MATQALPHDRLAENSTDVWLTPKWLIDACGEFDLDPCAAPYPRPWNSAQRHYDITRGEDGLALTWAGRVWLNPPFSEADAWVDRLIKHRAGILLLGAALETDRWMLKVWPHATAIHLVSPRVEFLGEDGKPRINPHTGKRSGPTKQTALVAFSLSDADVLASCDLGGVLLTKWTVKPRRKKVSNVTR